MISPSFPRRRVTRAPARGRLDVPQWYQCTTRSSVRAVSYGTHGVGHLTSYGGSRTVCNWGSGKSLYSDGSRTRCFIDERTAALPSGNCIALGIESLRGSDRSWGEDFSFPKRKNLWLGH